MGAHVGGCGAEEVPAAQRGAVSRRRAIGVFLVTAAVLAPTAASGHKGAAASLSKTEALMRLKLKAVTQRQDAALSKAEEILSSPIRDDAGADARAPPTPAFLKAGNGALELAAGTKLLSAGLAKKAAGGFTRAQDRRIAFARMGRAEDEGRNLRAGPEMREHEVDRREQAQQRRDRSSETKGADLGSEKRALEEADAFARLTAGARDPRAAAKKRLAQKSERESYERASNEGMIWKEINQMRHHAEDQTVRVDTSHGLSGEVRELASLSPPKAAQVLAKMSQTDGSAALGALKSIDPRQVQRILAALGEQQHAAQQKSGAAGGGSTNGHGGGQAEADEDGAHGASGKDAQHASSLHAPPPQFNIRTVNRFDPGESLSFAGGTSGGTFSLSYADTSEMTGYVCKDIVELGHYYAMTRFGCALDCNDPHFDGIDGILGASAHCVRRACPVRACAAKHACRQSLAATVTRGSLLLLVPFAEIVYHLPAGMGLPDAALANIPTPLFFAISHDRGGLEGANYINERPLHTRKFAFLSDSVSGELQLGGYDRESTAADMVYVRATSTTEYSVNVQSLSFGGIELLDWVDKTVPNAIPAIMDTGTTCLVIPDTMLGGRVSDKPYSKFKSIMTKGMSFYITIDGHLFEIPYEFWWQRLTHSPCVQPTPSSYAGILLGDVVFQSLVVEFDVTKPKACPPRPRPPLRPRPASLPLPDRRTPRLLRAQARTPAISCLLRANGASRRGACWLWHLTRASVRRCMQRRCHHVMSVLPEA